MDAKINELVTAMITLYHDDPKRIHHFMKVYAFASAIAQRTGQCSAANTN